MMRTIKVENYKSIHKLKLDLGRITVFIGENGSGKSNILEAIALTAAAAGNKLDNEFLVSRGLRVTEPQFMKSAFDQENILQEIKISIIGQDQRELMFFLQNDNRPYSKWINQIKIANPQRLPYNIAQVHQVKGENIGADIFNKIADDSVVISAPELARIFFRYLPEFLIYSPEINSLQTFQQEGQIQPLGIHGEGLFKLLKVLNADAQDKISKIKEKLRLIDWFKDFDIPNVSNFEQVIKIKDRYLEHNLEYSDQTSANEGFLFLLFYLALFISDDTPNFFAIDNIDASLNPRLCRRVMQELIQLAQEHDKQVIFTTHNPAILDGLNLEDEDQKLYVIYRNLSGHTKAKQIFKPETLPGEEPVKLSEAFIRGYLGGLPKNF